MSEIIPPPILYHGDVIGGQVIDIEDCSVLFPDPDDDVTSVDVLDVVGERTDGVGYGVRIPIPNILYPIGIHPSITDEHTYIQRNHTSMRCY